MFAHIVSPPTGGHLSMFRIDMIDGLAWKVRSLCHSSAIPPRLAAHSLRQFGVDRPSDAGDCGQGRGDLRAHSRKGALARVRGAGTRRQGLSAPLLLTLREGLACLPWPRNTPRRTPSPQEEMS